MEKQILQTLSKLGQTDFTILRADFPFTNQFGSSYKNLLALSLIEEKRDLNNTLISLTSEGIEATYRGLEKWVENMVLDEIKNKKFILTKDTTNIELRALRNLEDDDKIYEAEERKYKVVPSINRNEIDNSFRKRTKDNLVQQNQSKKIKRRFNINWKIIITVIARFIMTVIAILAILEVDYHYVSNTWKRIIEYLSN
jgi:hypothetical protein